MVQSSLPSMDELNYRRLTHCSKVRCEECGATSYQGPDGTYRCVVCDHQHFETCLDCGHLTGWCECPPEPAPAPAPKTRAATKKKARRPRATLRK